ncbi:type VI secretion system baseplate subunit TssE [Pseudomonas wadenswilerensis]
MTYGQGLGAESLFQRLDPDLPPRRTRTRQGVAAERIQAIKTNLEQLLNTRRGGSQSSPELGLPDMNDAASGPLALRDQLCEDIREMVARYEPRVSVLDIRPLTASEQPLGLCFRLHCLVPLADSSGPVEIDLLLHPRQQRIQVL